MQLRTMSESPSWRAAFGRVLTSRLGGADLAPSGLPPAATLLVRRLDGLGTLHFHSRAVRIDPDWERATRSRLGEVLRRAVRPRNGRPPPDAEAVLFADDAEMWACLALALLDGTASRRWYWRALLRGAPPLAALFVREARALPAMLDQLAAWGEAEAAVASLNSAEAGAVVSALVREHALPAALASPDEAGFAPQDVPDFTSPAAPWCPWSPRVAGLRREQEYLLGLGLGLCRAPCEVRSTAFVRRVKTWWRQPGSSAAAASFSGRRTGPPLATIVQTEPSFEAKEDEPDPKDTRIRGAKPRRRRRRGDVQGKQKKGKQKKASGEATSFSSRPLRRAIAAKGRNRFPRRTAAPDLHSGDPELPPHPFLSRPAPRAQTSSDGSSSPLPQGDGPGVRAPLSEGDREDREDREVKRLAGRTRGHRPLDDEPSARAALPLDLGLEGVPTRLGGVLYLIHVALAFELFETFEDDTGAWAVLARLARALVPDADPEDAIWRVLAELDGNVGAAAPPVADVADRLAGIVPAVRVRLAAALDDPSQEALADLLNCPGRLHVTAVHVDLVAGLEAISLAARRAGLDSDPGWVPALGRIVQIHFRDDFHVGEVP